MNRRKIKASISVSDHAMIRFLCRVEDLDMAVVTRAIVNSDLVRWVEEQGSNGIYPVNYNGRIFSVVVEDGAVKTLYPVRQNHTVKSTEQRG